MALKKIADLQEEIVEKGKRINRRIEKIQSDIDFMVDIMMTKSYEEMAAHRKLLQEWENEIEELKKAVEFLRKEWMRLESFKHN